MEDYISRQSKEKKNFWKTDTVIKDIATPAVRKCFNKLIPPSDLANVLNSNSRIIQDLCRKKVITSEQLDILASVPGVRFSAMSCLPHKKGRSSDDFDITLMICILRGLNVVPAPTNGWDVPPLEKDNTLGANLTRIRLYRNKIVHSAKNSMDDKIFRNVWTTLTKALSEISDGETDSLVHEIESFDFETGDRGELSWKIKDMQCLNLKENTSDLLEKWKHQLKNFYNTKGAKTVIKVTRENDVVLIIGNPGTGKTTAMKFASLQLEKEGFEVVPISSPNDIPTQRCSTRKQIFVMDDVIGKYRVDSVAFDLWRRLHDRLSVVFNGKGAKLLITLRRQLYKNITLSSFPEIFDSKVVDLDSNDLALTNDEKIDMLENYLKNRHSLDVINNVDKAMVCSCNTAFPLLCHFFSSNQHFLKRKADFFQNPSLVFIEELDRLQKDNPEVYCVLVLLLIFESRELQAIFDITRDICGINVYHLILRACEVPENIPRRKLLNQLNSVSGTFVESTKSFRFIHDRFNETVAKHFGSQFPDIMVKCCKPDFIRDRIRVRKSATDDENVIVLSFLHYDALAERILKEIKDGKFHDVLLCEPMQDEKFIEHFLLFVLNEGVSLDNLQNLKCTEKLLSHDASKHFRDSSLAHRFSLIEVLQNKKKLFIHWLTAMGSFPLFKAVFKREKNKLKQAYEKHMVITDLLHLAVLGENKEVIKLLIDRGGDVKDCDEYGIPLLCKVASTNRCDIADLLIDRGADVCQSDEIFGWSPCFVASWFNNFEMLQLLISRGAFLDELDFQARVPLVLAVMKDNEHIVSLLLKNDAEVYDKLFMDVEIPKNFNFLFQTALANNNQEIVKLLSDYRRTGNEIEVSFPPLYQNSALIKSMVDLFIKSIKEQDSQNALWRDFAAICDAVFSNDINTVYEILNKEDEYYTFSVLRGVLPNKKKKEMLVRFNQNYLRFSLLHIAAICDNVAAAKLFIEFGANPVQQDIRKRTSLHLANSSDMMDVLLSAEKKNGIFHQISLEK